MPNIIPCDLKIDRIHQLFKTCLAKENSTNIIRTVLFQKEYGFEKDSKPIFFDADKIKLAKPLLEFSLGELKSVHNNHSSINTESVKVRYDNVTWADSTAPIMAYLHMLLAAELITPVSAKTAVMNFTTNIIPTLLLSDPNYTNWIIKNKEKLLEKYYGKEPADD